MEKELSPPRRSISVVIPSYNGKRLLEANLPTVIAALDNCGVAYEIIVSDDGSSDDSLAFLAHHYPQAIVLASHVNYGFSTTINQGIRAATNDLVFLLNNDIQLSPAYFADQLPYFELADTFGVMGEIRVTGTSDLSEACKYPTRSLFKVNHFRNMAMAPAAAGIFTYYLSGANALVDREKLMALGGFEELYAPFYQEDLDLSLRAWRLGWPCYYEPRSVCSHEVSATIKSHHARRYIKVINERNKLILHYLHLQGLHLWAWCLVTVAALTVKWMFGNFEVYKATLLFLNRLEAVRRSKQAFTSRWQLHGIASVNEVKKRVSEQLDGLLK